MASCVLKEMGLNFEFDEKFQTKLGNRWHTARKLSPARMFSALALSQLIEEYAGIGMKALSCVDAIPGVGVAGIVWKTLFGEKVNVVINTIEGVKQNGVIATSNGKVLNAQYDITYVQNEPNSLLHSSQIVNFIYLEAYGNCVEYLESACHVISHKGIICIVSTDLSTLYNKSPERVRRLYHGHTMKNEYMKETAVRLILANLARAASRWGRGFTVLLSYADGDSIVIAARMFRGATHADRTLDLVQKIAHCRECQFWCLRDEKLHLTEKCDNTSCFCVEGGQIDDGVLPPIILLGPIYTGPIFETNILYKMKKKLEILNPKHQGLTTIQNMILECCCCDSDDDENELLKILAGNHAINSGNSQATVEPPAKKSKTVTFESLSAKYSGMEFPVLFTIPQTHTKKGCNPPKVLEVMQKLRSHGYRASRTIFDPRGVRTSAPLKDLCQLIDDISKETCVS